MRQDSVIMISQSDPLYKVLIQLQGLAGLENRLSRLERLMETIANGGVEKLTYTVQEVARATGLSNTSVKSLFHDGKLEGVQAGKGSTILIHKDSLHSYLEGRQDSNLQVINKAS